MRAYKVFLVSDDGVLASINQDTSMTLTYKKGEKTVAPGNTRLFTFSTMKYAYSFISAFDLSRLYPQVWEVEAGNYPVFISRVSPSLHPRAVNSFWERWEKGGGVETVYLFSPEKKELKWYSTAYAPGGTMVCKWVIPIKRVKVKNGFVQEG